MINHLYLKLQNNIGFTLVEVLVSISLLLLVLVGPLTYLAGSSQSTQIANEQIPAIFLAQESTELVHKVRDDELVKWFRNNFTGTPWNDMKTFLNPCFSSNGCGLEIDAGDGVQKVTVHPCSSNGCTLYKSESVDERSKYTYDDSSDLIETPYRRIVYLDEVIVGREIEIVSEVTWRSGNLIQDQSVEVKTSIFNVYDTN